LSNLTNIKALLVSVFHMRLEGKVHLFHHTTIRLYFLDHSNLADTTVYLRRLEGEQDKNWAKVAETISLTILS